MILILLLLCICGTVILSQYLLRKFGFSALEYSLEFSEDEASEGDTVTLTETICSRKPLPLPWVKAELTTHSALGVASSQSSVSEDTRFISSYFCLFPYRRIERRWRVSCTQRGIFTVSHAVLVLSDLFGTTELSRPFPNAEAHITVLPAVRTTDVLQNLPHQLTGDVIRRRTLIPDRFAVSGIRPYAEGDAVRDICWTATARSPQPMVWQYRETSSPSITVLLNAETRETDRESVSDRAAYEDAIRLCAACFGQALRLHMPMRFASNAAVGELPAMTPFSAGQPALLRHLRMLAALSDSITGRFSQILQRICAEDHAAAILIVTVRPTAELVRLAAADPRLTVLSLRPLLDSEQRPNIFHIPIPSERKPVS